MKEKQKLPIGLLKNPLHFISLGFGTGLMPKAPGTFGTLAAIPIYWLVKDLSLFYYGLFTLMVVFIGIYLCHYTSSKLKVHDHPGIVVDEIAGYLITMVAVPAELQWIILGFVLFRLFDIVKPWPISWLDKHVKGGLGIMIDDVLAGLLALLFMHATVYFAG